MTNHKQIRDMIFSELDDFNGSGREEVLTALALAFIAAYDDEVEDPEFAHYHDQLGDMDAYHYYCQEYDAAVPGVPMAVRREVSVPDWAPGHRRLLKFLARRERIRDDNTLRILQGMAQFPGRWT